MSIGAESTAQAQTLATSVAGAAVPAVGPDGASPAGQPAVGPAGAAASGAGAATVTTTDPEHKNGDVTAAVTPASMTLVANGDAAAPAIDSRNLPAGASAAGEQQATGTAGQPRAKDAASPARQNGPTPTGDRPALGAVPSKEAALAAAAAAATVTAATAGSAPAQPDGNGTTGAPAPRHPGDTATAPQDAFSAVRAPGQTGSRVDAGVQAAGRADAISPAHPAGDVHGVSLQGAHTVARDGRVADAPDTNRVQSTASDAVALKGADHVPGTAGAASGAPALPTGSGPASAGGAVTATTFASGTIGVLQTVPATVRGDVQHDRPGHLPAGSHVGSQHEMGAAPAGAALSARSDGAAAAAAGTAPRAAGTLAAMPAVGREALVAVLSRPGAETAVATPVATGAASSASATAHGHGQAAAPTPVMTDPTLVNLAPLTPGSAPVQDAAPVEALPGSAVLNPIVEGIFVRQGTLRSTPSSTSFHVVLQPQALGTVSVTVERGQDGLQVTIVPQQSATQTLLDRHLHELVSMLSTPGGDTPRVSVVAPGAHPEASVAPQSAPFTVANAGTAAGSGFAANAGGGQSFGGGARPEWTGWDENAAGLVAPMAASRAARAPVTRGRAAGTSRIDVQA